jgi:hypothetical protein
MWEDGLHALIRDIRKYEEEEEEEDSIEFETITEHTSISLILGRLLQIKDIYTNFVPSHLRTYNEVHSIYI